MQHDFWHRRWRKNEISFHEEDGNWLLKQYFNTLHLRPNSRVFVPFCGKTKDIGWLLSNNMQVVAVELDESAVIQLMQDLGGGEKIGVFSDFKHYQLPDLDVYVGDFFALNASILGKVDAVFDRGAMVALPLDLRQAYAPHLAKITVFCPQLLVCYQYQQALFDGPPFNVSHNEVKQHYAEHFVIDRLHHERVEGGFRGHEDVFEVLYKLDKPAE